LFPFNELFPWTPGNEAFANFYLRIIIILFFVTFVNNKKYAKNNKKRLGVSLFFIYSIRNKQFSICYTNFSSKNFSGGLGGFSSMVPVATTGSKRLHERSPNASRTKWPPERLLGRKSFKKEK